jgi:hypothetical protein
MSAGGPGAPDDVIRNVSVHDEEVLEEWQRSTAEPAIRNVYATKVSQTGWSWQVSFGILEFVREDPLRGELLMAITDELTGLDGVDQVAQDDTEVFVVRGSPTGEDLVRAAGRAVDALSGRLREHYDQLRTRAPVLPRRPPFDENQINRMREQKERSRQAFHEFLTVKGVRELTPEESAAQRQRRRGQRTRGAAPSDPETGQAGPDS